MTLKGKVALVTGGTRGIGRATAIDLARRGCNVAVNYFSSRDSAQETVELLQGMGVQAVAFRGNVGNSDKLVQMVEETIEQMGGIDILVSNAASGALKPVMELSAKDWTRTLDINARALLVAAQTAAPSMKARGGGCIVALTSQGSTHVIPNYAAVGTSKAAIESLVRYLAAELASDGIRVNAVSGGVVDTQSLRRIPGGEHILEQSARRTPMGRNGTPDDLAGVVTFLCDDASRWITGQVLIVDGGYSLLV